MLNPRDRGGHVSHELCAISIIRAYTESGRRPDGQLFGESARLLQDSKPSCQRRIDCLCRVIGATALPGLWRIQFQALSKYLDGTRTAEQVHQAVAADVRSAAQLIDTGLNSFAPLARDGHPAAADATQHARRRTLSHPSAQLIAAQRLTAVNPVW
jgi:hypothetical protein